VLAALYGVEIARQMLEILAEEDDMRLTGYTSPASLTRSNRREITFFVNGRPVQDAALVSALIQAYHTMLMVGKYPQAILFLEMPPEVVDVNVHPAKAEVRFRDSNRVFTFVQSAIRRALLAYSPVPEISQGLQWAHVPPAAPSFPERSKEGRLERGISLDWDIAGVDERDREIETAPGHSSEAPSQPELQGQRAPLLRLVGQVASAYLVAEGPDGLYLVDQHAAHERVLFERFTAQRGRGQIPAQALLQAAAVDLPPAAARLLEGQLPVLEQLGFQVEPFGTGTFLVRAIPSLLSGMDPAAALRVLVEDFEEDESPLQAEVEARIIARVCKRAAVKAGKTLSLEEQRALLADLEACQSPRTCPHGRPTMIHLSVDLLERQFGRKGPR
jgi:DNA mismatch repair protein MutL